MDGNNTTSCLCLTSMGTETCQQHSFHRRRKTYLNDERVTGESFARSDQKDRFYSDCDSTINKIVRMNSDDSLNNQDIFSDKMEFTARSKENAKTREQYQFDVEQQGPDLQQDSPRSTRSSPKINAGSGNVSMNNSPALQHKNQLVTESESPSPPPPSNVPSSFQQNQLQQPNMFSPLSQSQNFQQSSFGVTGATQNSVVSSQSPAMIFGPNTNPTGYYYSPYPQQPNVRPLGPYEPHNVQQQQPAVIYQPFMSHIMPPGGMYYAPNMGPYMVNAQPMPWIQAHTDFTAMNYQPNANLVYSSHPHMQHQQHYVQPNYSHQTILSGHPAHVDNFTHRDEITYSAPNTPRDDSEHKFIPNAPPRRNSLKVEKQLLSMTDKSEVIPMTISPRLNENIDSNEYEKLSQPQDYTINTSNTSPEIIALTNVDSPHHGTNRYHTGAKLELEHGRTPLFGACPAWWGENETENEEDESLCISLNVQSECQQKSSPQFQRKNESASDCEGRMRKQEPPANFQLNKHSRRENIRMDIPFSSAEPAEQEDTAEKQKNRASSAATCFTIEFTPTDDAKKRRSISKPLTENKAEDRWKMQSAERVHTNFVRRSLRKAGGITPETHPLTMAVNAKQVESKEQELRETAKDPKAYLLNKMLTSDAEEPVKLPKEINIRESQLPASVVIRPRRNSDAGSDAGTYVVDRDQEQEEEMKARLRIDQVFGVRDGSRSSSSSCERTPSPISYEEAVINKPRKPMASASALTPKQYCTTSKALPTSNSRPVTQPSIAQSLADKEEEKKKKGLLKQLLKISQQPDHRRSLPTAATVPKPDPPPPVRRSILKKNNSSVGNAYSNSAAITSTSSSNSFARAEAGRLSLRSTSCSGSTPKPMNPAAKSKISAAKTAKDNEMSLWLRRKEYNPMKAAAEAKTKKTPTTNSSADPPYLSNRSQSFHTGAILPKGSLRKHQSIEDSLAADSDLDPLSDCTTVASFSRNFAASLNRLSRGVESDNDVVARRSKTFDPDSINSLARLSKELGFHAKGVLDKLQDSNSGSHTSKSVDNVFSCTDDPSEEDSLEHSGSAGITGLVKQLELANQAFAVVDQFLKNQNDKNAIGEPSDPTSPREKSFQLRRTRLTKLETKMVDSHNRGFSNKDDKF